MTSFMTNPAYIFPAIILVAVLIYYGYGAMDRFGGDISSEVAEVTGKQYNPAGKSYYNTVVGGKSWVQTQETPETHALTLNIAGEATVGLVSKQMYEVINNNDQVNVKIRRTRFSKKLEVIEVTR